jgi:predicted nucleic acid-binding Zn ribbon protein
MSDVNKTVGRAIPHSSSFRVPSIDINYPNPPKMSLKPIAKLAIEIQTEPGWEGVRDWGIIVRAWDETVSPALASNSRPKSIAGSILTIATNSASLSHQLTFGRKSLCLQFNNRLIDIREPFTDLRFAPIGYNDRSISSAVEDEYLPIHGGDIVICPTCSCRSRQGELSRWGVCQFCAIDIGILGSR